MFAVLNVNHKIIYLYYVQIYINKKDNYYLKFISLAEFLLHTYMSGSIIIFQSIIYVGKMKFNPENKNKD